MGSPEPTNPSDHARPIVLIVDDDEYVYGALEAALRGLHVQLLTARTAAEAEALAQRHRPALAIVDVGLPDRDGYRLTADLRRAGFTSTRILILTGHTPDQRAARAAGADALLGKPFRLHQFLEIVRAQLGARPDASGGPALTAPSSGIA